MSLGLATGVLASALKFLACVTVLNEPDFWDSDHLLPDRFIPQLYNREKLFREFEDLLREGKSWPVVARSHAAVVRGKHSARYRRMLYYAEATMPATPKQMLDIFWADGMSIPKWNPTAMDVEVVKDFDSATRVTWQSTKAQVAGLISARDFVNLNFWRSHEETTIDIAYTNATWPSKPPTTDYVRGQNGPSGMRFTQQPGSTETKMSWVFNAEMHFSAFIPNAVLSRVIPTSLIEYLGYLRKHAMTRE